MTPRRTRLVRVPDLHAFRHAIVGFSLAGDPGRLTSRVVLVPTAGAAHQLRRTLRSERMPTLATREEFYDCLHARLDTPIRRLTAYDRDVMLQSAAREASVSLGIGPSLRPGLLAEMLRFYDQLRRQARDVARFEELLDETLSRDRELDRGAERMLAQARFLARRFTDMSVVSDLRSVRRARVARTIDDPRRHPTRFVKSL